MMRGVGFLALIPLLLVVLACQVSAQQPPTDRQAPPLDPVHTRAPVFSPRSGPSGTEVTVHTRDLPAVTPVYLGIGATRSSFEVLSQLVTDQCGEMSEVIQIPTWATPDRTHFFVLVDVYFRPLAVSDGFHVTEQDGTLTRSGQITDEGGSCLVLRENESDELYSLTGATDGLEPGDPAVVKGRVAEASICMQGTTIGVTRVESR